MVLDVQEKNTFMENNLEKVVNKEEKIKGGLFTIKPSYYGDGKVEGEKVNGYILCGCGHRGYVKVRDNIELEEESVLNLLCPGCQENEVFYSNRTFRITYLHFRDKKNMIQLAVAGFHYKFNTFSAWDSSTGLLFDEERLKIQAIPIKTVISTNKTSRATYQINPENNRIRNISRVGIIGDYERELLNKAYSDPLYQEKMATWYKTLVSGIPSYVLDEWRISQKGDDFESFWDFLGFIGKVFLISANPYLQLMGRDTYIPLRRSEERALVKQARKKIDVFRILLPAISKATLKLLEHPDYAHAYFRFEILGMIENKDFLKEAILSFHYQRSYIASTRTMSHIVEETLYSKRMKKNFIRTFFGTNKIFERRLISKGDNEQTNMNLGLVHDALSLYARTLNMMKKLSPEKRQEKEGYLNYVPKESINELHDRLSALVDTFVRENKQIEYSTGELNKWNRTYDTVEFSLVEDTHELIRVGREMHICVGGYDVMAFSKECLIVVGRINGKSTICVEINKGKIMQIKKRYNLLLSTRDGEVTKDMRRYINETNAELKTRDFDYELKESNTSLREHRRMLLENEEQEEQTIGYEATGRLPLAPNQWGGPMVEMDDLPF